MATRPPILAAELRARLALDEAGLGELLAAAYAAIPPRQFDAAAYRRALGYPWRRPAGSYALRDGVVEELAGLGAERRSRLLATFTAPAAGRLPLLAIGSNAAPAALARKLADLADAEDRALLVVLGWLHEFDIGPAAHLAVYGSLPATPFASPGTAVETAILWVTPRQFERLTWSEMSYGLGRLRAKFTAAAGEGALDEVLVFASRFGAFRPEGRPVALAAIPARGRTAAALSQEEILRAAAALVLGPGAEAGDLVRAIHEDPGATIELVGRRLRPAGIPFSAPGWSGFAKSGDLRGIPTTRGA